MNADVAVATMTLARNTEEAMRLRQSLRSLADAGFRIAIGDGGSDPAFISAIRGWHGVELAPVAAAGGLVAQVQASLLLAQSWGTRHLLYTEPDKQVFFRDHLTAFLGAALARRDAALVIASRSPAGFATFPPGQRYAESVASQLCGEVTGLTGDYFYGPFLMERTVADLARGAPAAVGWGWRPRLFAIASRSARQIAAVQGDFTCPPAQRHEGEAERVYRMQQLAENISGLVDGCQWSRPC